MMMDSGYYWEQFLHTGSLAAYLLYKEFTEHVPDHDGDRPERNEIQ